MALTRWSSLRKIYGRRRRNNCVVPGIVCGLGEEKGEERWLMTQCRRTSNRQDNFLKPFLPPPPPHHSLIGSTNLIRHQHTILIRNHTTQQNTTQGHADLPPSPPRARCLSPSCPSTLLLTKNNQHPPSRYTPSQLLHLVHP